MKKRIFSFLLSGCMLCSLASATTSVVSAKQQVENVSSPLQMAKVMNTNVQQSKLNGSEKAKKSELESFVIVKTPAAPEDTHGATNVFYYEYGGYYILKYENAAKAKEAVYALKRAYPRHLIFQDKMVKQEKPAVSSAPVILKSLKKTVPDKPVMKSKANKKEGVNLKNQEEEFPAWLIELSKLLKPTYGDRIMGMDKLKKEAVEKKWKWNKDEELQVAVIDSGINTDHKWFKNELKNLNRIDEKNSANFASDSGAPVDYQDMENQGHGSHVSGIIANSTPDYVKIMALRVFDRGGHSSLERISMALDHARKNGAEVVNMSLGQGFASKADELIMGTAIKNCISKGMVVCSAAGNESRNVNYSYPASSGLTIAVGSMVDKKRSGDVERIRVISQKHMNEIAKYQGVLEAEPADENIDPNTEYTKSAFSNYGEQVDFVAYGESIESAWVGKSVIVDGEKKSSFKIDTGTSMATPYVAAAAAMVKFKHPDFNQWDVYATFRDLSVDIGKPGKDADTGYGWINLKNFADRDTLNAGDKKYQSIQTEKSIIKDMNSKDKWCSIVADVTKGDGSLKFESTDPKIVEVKGNKYRVKGVGKCKINVTASETVEYKETVQPVSMDIRKGDQSIKLSKKHYLVDDTAKNIKIKASVVKPADGKISFITNWNERIDLKSNGVFSAKKPGKVLVYAVASRTENFNRTVSEGIVIEIIKHMQQAKGLKVKALKKRKVQIKFNGIPGAKAYEIQFSTKKNKGFKNIKTVKSDKKLVLKSKKLKKGKTYYFRLRAYKIVKGHKFYGKYSSVKKIKIKK